MPICPLTSRCLLFVFADDESDSDAEEEQTTVRAVAPQECAMQPRLGSASWQVLLSLEAEERGWKERAPGGLAAR